MHRIAIIEHVDHRGAAALLDAAERFFLQSGDTAFFVSGRRVFGNGFAVYLDAGNIRILKGEAGQFNDFDNSPLGVEVFYGIQDNKVKLPACCVVELTIG